MRTPETVQKALARAAQAFTTAGIASARLDARLLLQAATGLDHAGLIAEPDFVLTEAMALSFDAHVARRVAREPVSKILGAREFYGRMFTVTGDVLDPRPDTETLVELALEYMPLDRPSRVLDLGVGSGAILLTLLAERPLAFGVGIDVSPAALVVANGNGRALGLTDRVEYGHGYWWEPVTGQFNVIVSNPPYIPATDIAGLEPDVRVHDPLLALDGGQDGLEPYRVIAARAWQHLAPGGIVAVEFGAGQGPAVEDIFQSNGCACCARRNDLAGHLRAMAFTIPG
jgi:release factor glutamine methyltransferase